MKKIITSAIVLMTFWFVIPALVFADRVPTQPSLVKPLYAGKYIPKGVLKNLEGQEVTLASVINKPTVLVFYRGGWCPYCNRHLGSLQSIESQLLEMGYQIVAISPDRPEKLKETSQKQKINYKLYSDSSTMVIKAFALGFRLDDETFNLYKNKYGIDLEANSGFKHHILPVPAVYLITKEGRIVYSYYHIDYKVRLNNEILLEEAKKHSKE